MAMSENLENYACDNLDPKHFVFWKPFADQMIHVGSDQHPVSLPRIPLPVKRKDICAVPSDNAIGQGVYDYLRQFPDCRYNREYAELLRDGYAHFLADLAAHVVMLDAKDVEPAYVFRKLSYLKILQLLEPDNVGLLWQLAHGFYGLAITFTELPQVRRHLLAAMRFGQALLKLRPGDQAAMNLLAEIDILFGDYPAAIAKFEKLLPCLADRSIAERLADRVRFCREAGFPDHPLVDDLELAGEAMQLYAATDYRSATERLERLEEDTCFMAECSSADFFCLLGMCRVKTGDRSGALAALSQALELEPDHQQARETLESI